MVGPREHTEAMARREHQGGFTLLELLVVIVVITIVASLLLPEMMAARSSAWSVRCQSNLRQLGVGLSMYVGEHHSYPFRFGKINNGAGYGLEQWSTLLEPYMDSGPNAPRGGVFECPAEEGRKEWLKAQPITISKVYGLNAFGYTGGAVPPKGLAGDGTKPSAPTRETDVVAPSDMIALGDAAGNGPNGSVMVTEGLLRRAKANSIILVADPTPWIRYAQKRHQGKVNLTFCDGHIESYKANRLFLDQSDNALRKWNRDNQPHR